jgi:hypothetical protein
MWPAKKRVFFSYNYRIGKKGIHLLVAEKRLASKGEGFSTLTIEEEKRGIHLLVAEKRAVLTCGGQQGRGFTC